MQQKTSGVLDNVSYDLVSTLHHTLEAEQAYTMYLKDAQTKGDQELVKFYQKACQQEKQCAEEAKQLLAKQISKH